MKKTTIYLVRHAEVKNPKGIYYVWLPRFGLSEMGYFQAKKLRDYFKNKPINQIISSPLLRARKTAQIIANGEIKVKFSKYITEINAQAWQGKKINERPVSEVRSYIENPDKADFLGEHLHDVQFRMIKKINQVVNKYQGKNIIIVSHADPIISVILYYQNTSLDKINDMSLKNASITKLIFNGNICERVEYKEIVPAKEDGV